MTEAESHTLAWKRRIDGKLDGLAVEPNAFRASTAADRARIRWKLMVPIAICVRREAGPEQRAPRLATLERDRSPT